jgi:mRNA-degrading endonuclease RelE of RelBE toxin-antitoxin system
MTLPKDDKQRINDFLEKIKNNPNDLNMNELKEILSLPEVQKNIQNSMVYGNNSLTQLEQALTNNSSGLFTDKYDAVYSSLSLGNKNFNDTQQFIKDALTQQVTSPFLAPTTEEKEKFLDMLKNRAEEELKYLPENQREAAKQKINDKIGEYLSIIRGTNNTSKNKPKQ